MIISANDELVSDLCYDCYMADVVNFNVAACLSKMWGDNKDLLLEKTMTVQDAVDYVREHGYMSEDWIQRLLELQGVYAYLTT